MPGVAKSRSLSQRISSFLLASALSSLSLLEERPVRNRFYVGDLPRGRRRMFKIHQRAERKRSAMRRR